ncbi:hypothetical protein CLOSTMETH_00076 [[Clostridium] methylpentosum DSM 5476]|uniref:Uncharacterized protein n=1 Tax=[Clostridium] methylpentosum DSM 5476 TaxID=537013 RepID=C0E8D1_9FIRM|nr:hypothetical protein CLOSTMETH_00076 [[Clostridium] methylpentosum DSM 5476]
MLTIKTDILLFITLLFVQNPPSFGNFFSAPVEPEILSSESVKQNPPLH